MYVPNSPITPMMKLYRKQFLFKSLFLIMFLCDLILFLFSPAIVFVLVLLIHGGIFIAFMNSRCFWISAMVKELSAQKDCAPAPEVVK